MRKNNEHLKDYRIRTGPYGSTDKIGMTGAFVIPSPHRAEDMFVISSDDESSGWEHVSVSFKKHIPSWKEMSFIKELFWEDEEAVMQLHPPRSQYVNNHEACLHLWRPLKETIPLPSTILVGLLPRKE